MNIRFVLFYLFTSLSQQLSWVQTRVEPSTCFDHIAIYMFLSLTFEGHFFGVFNLSCALCFPMLPTMDLGKQTQPICFEFPVVFLKKFRLDILFANTVWCRLLIDNYVTFVQ